jgi:hypothetical protein
MEAAKAKNWAAEPQDKKSTVKIHVRSGHVSLQETNQYTTGSKVFTE